MRGRSRRKATGPPDPAAPDNTVEVQTGTYQAFQDLFESLPIGIAVTTQDGVAVDVNPALLEMLGYDSKKEALSKPFADHYADPADRKRFLEAREESAVRDFEVHLKRRDGTLIWVSINSAGRSTIGGEPRTLTTFRDITERKQAEEALRRSEEWFRLLFDLAPDGYYLSDLKGTFLDGNQAAEVIVGQKREELIGKNFLKLGLLSPAQLPRAARLLAENLRGRPTGPDEFTLNRASGDQVTVEILTCPTVLEGKKVVLGIARDISERKRTEEELLKKEAHESLVLGSLPMALYIAQPFGDFGGTWVSDQIKSISGFSAEDFIKEKGLWAARLHPEDRDGTLLAFDRAEETGSVMVEYRWQRADGQYIWLLDQGVLVREDDGAPREIIGIWLDISDRKRIERELQEKEIQLVQSQKMEAIGRLAGGVAHDFNNMLGVIIGYSDMVLRRLDEADPLRVKIEQIKKTADKAADLTQQLLVFSRKESARSKVLNLNDVVEGTVKILQRLIGEDITLGTELSENPGYVRADPSHLDQVIINLAVNARDAMPEGGELVISTGEVEVTDGQTSAHGDTEPGHYVRLTIADSGHGMDEDTLTHIFEPFFTTKETGRGTGLGLATVYGVVQQIGGFIQVESKEGMGAAFKIYLPRVEEAAEAEERPDWADVAAGAGETVLLVEDDDAFRAMVVEILDDLGYSVLEARSGVEALLHCDRHQEPIDVMLTDVIMPQMSGRQLAEMVSPLHPETRIIFMSGYTDDALGQHGVLDSDWQFIEKPFTAEALGLKLREALGGTGPNTS